MLKIDAETAKLFKAIGTSAKGAARFKADRIRAHVEGLGEVTLYVTAYGATPEAVTEPKRDAAARAPKKEPVAPSATPAKAKTDAKAEAKAMLLKLMANKLGVPAEALAEVF